MIIRCCGSIIPSFYHVTNFLTKIMVLSLVDIESLHTSSAARVELGEVAVIEAVDGLLFTRLFPLKKQKNRFNFFSDHQIRKCVCVYTRFEWGIMTKV